LETQAASYDITVEETAQHLSGVEPHRENNTRFNQIDGLNLLSKAGLDFHSSLIVLKFNPKFFMHKVTQIRHTKDGT